MPALFLKQPNGRYARWSSVVDAFTHLNMTRAEARLVASGEMGVLEAQQKIERADRDEDEAQQPGDGLGRWREALKTMRALGKAAEADEAEEIDRSEPPLVEVDEPPLVLDKVGVMYSEPQTLLCTLDGIGIATIHGKDRAERERIAEWMQARLNNVADELRRCREALTQVKVDHLNRRIELPVETHALVENTLATTGKTDGH